MTTQTVSRPDEKPTDKYAQSDQAPPPGKAKTEQFLSDTDADDIVEDAAEDSFPASDPPAYRSGDANREGRPTQATDR